MSAVVPVSGRAPRRLGRVSGVAAGNLSLDGLAVVARWATTTVALTGAFISVHSVPTLHRQLLAGGVLIAYSAARTLQLSSRWPSPEPGRISGLLDVLVCSCLVLATGGWGSPYLLAVGGALIVAGMVGGRRTLLLGMGVLVAGVLVGVLLDPASVPPATMLERAVELAVMGGVGLAVRRAQLRAAGEQDELDRLRSATAINELLLELYAMTSAQPGTLTVDRAVLTVVERVRALFAPEVVVVLLFDPASAILDRPWQVAAAEGAVLPATLADGDLPVAMRRALEEDVPAHCDDLGGHEALGTGSASALYIPLSCGSTRVGVLALEGSSPGGFSGHHPDSLRAVALHAGLVIENARIFARLKILGADEERQRFARELHDRVGQALTAVALTAERAQAGGRAEPAEVLGDLRTIACETRRVIREVREKLTDLRSEPGDGAPLAELLVDLCARVRARSGLEVSCQVACPSLPESTEREVWRVACEAVSNAERHAAARWLSLRWVLDRGRPTLIVSDDGNGLLGREPLRRDAYGVRGMRERAEIIGGRLQMASRPGAGTTVRLVLPGPGPDTEREPAGQLRQALRSRPGAGRTGARASEALA